MRLESQTLLIVFFNDLLDLCQTGTKRSLSDDTSQHVVAFMLPFNSFSFTDKSESVGVPCHNGGGNSMVALV